jgi:hypothetical protein
MHIQIISLQIVMTLKVLEFVDHFTCYFKLLIFFFSCSGKHLRAFKKTRLFFCQYSRWMTESTELGCYPLQFNFIVASLNITM